MILDKFTSLCGARILAYLTEGDTTRDELITFRSKISQTWGNVEGYSWPPEFLDYKLEREIHVETIPAGIERAWNDRAGFVFASIESSQKWAYAQLMANGFVPCTPWIRNPNSQNPIRVFVKIKENVEQCTDKELGFE